MSDQNSDITDPDDRSLIHDPDGLLDLPLSHALSSDDTPSTLRLTMESEPLFLHVTRPAAHFTPVATLPPSPEQERAFAETYANTVDSLLFKPTLSASVTAALFSDDVARILEEQRLRDQAVDDDHLLATSVRNYMHRSSHRPDLFGRRPIDPPPMQSPMNVSSPKIPSDEPKPSSPASTYVLAYRYRFAAPDPDLSDERTTYTGRVYSAAEALLLLDQGKRLRRLNWRRSLVQLRMTPVDNPGVFYPRLVECWPSGVWTFYEPTAADLLATDWVLA